MAKKIDHARRLIEKMDKRLGRIERKLGLVSDLLGDASQKLCHLIKRQRERSSYAED